MGANDAATSASFLPTKVGRILSDREEVNFPQSHKLFRKHPRSSAWDTEKNEISFFFPQQPALELLWGEKFFIWKNTVRAFLSDTMRTGSWMVNLAGELEVPFGHELSAFCGDDSVCFAEEVEMVAYFDKAGLFSGDWITNIASAALPFVESEGLGGYPKKKRRNRYYHVYKSDFQITDVEIMPLIHSLMQKTPLYFSK